jgi:adenylate kinase family enzyme
MLMVLSACSNIGEKRSLLAAAGFKTIPATTPAQLERLHSIKSSKVVPLNGTQGTVYVFADKAKNSLMVGSPAQYQQYRALKLKQQQIDEKLLDAQVNMNNADYSAWGTGTDWGWGVASAPY